MASMLAGSLGSHALPYVLERSLGPRTLQVKRSNCPRSVYSKLPPASAPKPRTGRNLPTRLAAPAPPLTTPGPFASCVTPTITAPAWGGPTARGNGSRGGTPRIVTQRSVGLASVPELTRSAPIKLNTRVSLSTRTEALSVERPTISPKIGGPHRQSRQANILGLAALFSIAKEIKQMKKGWSFKDDRRLMELARSGKTLQEIAKAMNWSSDRIRKVAVRLGLPVKSQTPKQ